MDSSPDITPPFLTRDDLSFKHGAAFGLRVETSAFTAESLLIQGMTKEDSFTFVNITTNTGNRVTTNYRIPDIPILISVTEKTPTVLGADCYVRVILTLNGNALYELCSGYVSSYRSLSYPQVNNMEMGAGAGTFKVVTGADPAAGAEAFIQVGTGQIWRFISFNVQLVNAAVAASRRVHLKLAYTPQNVECFSSIDQTTGQTMDYTFAAYGHIPDEQDSNQILVNTPGNLWLLGGTTVYTATTNLQATDDYGAPAILVESFVYS